MKWNLTKGAIKFLQKQKLHIYYMKTQILKISTKKKDNAGN